uniref:Uncharacterized protein n=1 Tax=Odontella aurita TaxID=265563 RepID=A0A7S4MD03_9STRA|mmetsp:Transcript_17912/g.51964  ORF Transcript_17912/g.51964 Transcript_17912/m.51964 type:complete len:393 (+) Transcript_17912:376-1554(+)
MATLDFLAVVLIATVLILWCNLERRSRRLSELVMDRAWAVMPLFVLFASLSWVLAGGFLLGVVFWGDYCAAPDVHSIKVMTVVRRNLVRSMLDNLSRLSPPNVSLVAGVEEALSLINEPPRFVRTNSAMDALEMIRTVELLDDDEGDDDDDKFHARDFVDDFAVAVVVESGKFYVSQCNEEFLPVWYVAMTELQSAADTVAGALMDFLTNATILHSHKEFPTICGLAEAEAIVQSAWTLRDRFVSARSAGKAALDILACGNLNPIWNTFMHDGVCVENVDWLTWVFATGLCIALFSLTMVTLRSSWYTPFVQQSEECLSESKEDEVSRKQRERRGQRRVFILWGLLIAAMLAALLITISYGFDGFKGQSRHECPEVSEQADLTWENETTYEP